MVPTPPRSARTVVTNPRMAERITTVMTDSRMDERVPTDPNMIVTDPRGSSRARK